MEHNEAWPSGRTNHYWFDLNRDWLVAQQPESQARIKKFHEWKPNFLTDHHEQGTNATFFFMPGEPTRVNPITPQKNQDITRKMGLYHAKALDDIGSLYFSQEGYDDFYYGKGSTFPDANGAIGVLFEQASSRGHAQESVNGVLRFPFTIRNHFTTMLSSLKAANDMREELLNYQRDFYKTAVAEAAKDPIKAYLFGSKDKARSYHLAQIMNRQQIELYRPASSQTINGKTFDAESSFIVPLNQTSYRLIKGMFDKQVTFTDSLFYDISSWVLPLAAGVDYEEVKTTPTLGAKVTDLLMPKGKLVGTGTYAYVIEPYGYYTPRVIYRLLKKGILIKVATEPFYNTEGKKFDRGSILIPVDNQEAYPQVLETLMKEVTENDGLDVYAFATGLDYKGVSLGSSSFLALKKPEIAIVVEGGVSANDAGELWHLLDQRYDIPVTMLPVGMLTSAALNRYTTLIFPAGNYSAITESVKEKLKTWVANGGVAIGFEQALTWFNAAGLGKFDMNKEGDKKEGESIAKPYGDIQKNAGAQETSGLIIEAQLDLSHPLLYGYYTSKIPMFKSNNLFMEKAKGAYANPLTYGKSPLVSGYISKANYPNLKHTAGLGVSVHGRGRVIGFTENLAFRAFWFGTNKMAMNAIFYGALISPEAGR